jgi:hypothetical protein
MRPPELKGILTRTQVAQTGAAIVAAQEPDGALPWPDGHTDAWNHVESAMGLLVAGERRASERAYAWLRSHQAADGSWAMSYERGAVVNPDRESNQAAYVATGVWHHWLITRDRSFVSLMWPVVVRALNYVVGMQSPGGEIPWARRPDESIYPDVLITGCSSTLQSLRCGLAIADLMGEQQPDWELAAGALHHSLEAHPEVFTPKDRWSMDWYYPVLGGALRGDRGHERIAEQWDTFVVAGLGARCVSDEPWVTGAETCELAIALHTLGDDDRARRLVSDMQHSRHSDGGYWTGWQFANQVMWPQERSSWTSAAVLLAVDALSGGPTSELFCGNDLPRGLDAECVCEAGSGGSLQSVR